MSYWFPILMAWAVGMVTALGLIARWARCWHCDQHPFREPPKAGENEYPR